jgi:N-acyl-D-aspartate/D-glutamate deacylase
MDEGDVRTVMQHPLQMVGSDGIPSPGKPHPRLYGTFPRLLGRYVRELGVLSLESAIHKMAGRSAATFGLTERGLIAAGCFADICVFDYDRVIDRATWAEPTLPPEGIVHVFCNGAATMLDGVRTEHVPGRYVG